MKPSVAKLDIAADSDSEGRGFESLRADQQNFINIKYSCFYICYQTFHQVNKCILYFYNLNEK